MLSFENPRLIKVKPKPYSWDVREYISPNNQWGASFTDPFEWHMGADGWKLTLKSNGEDVTRNHLDLVKSVSSKGFRCPKDLVPWSYDSRFLMLITWEKEPLVLYDIIAQRRLSCPVEGFPFSSQWDPVGDNNAVIFEDNAIILNSSGQIQAKVHWPSVNHELPQSFWLGDSHIFFVITLNPENRKTEARFFRSSGELLELLTIDPATLVPFDHEQFSCIDRNEYTLVIDKATKGAGSMLDSWHDIRFDQTGNVLQLATYRPVGAPYKSEGIVVCDAEELWLVVNISTQQSAADGRRD